MNTMDTVRVRIAPSPTGYPHIGTVYQALFNYAFAKRYRGQFIVRIEDTDRERFVLDAEEKIFQALDWFNLQEDESPRKSGACGPYRSSERLDIYRKYALKLLEKENAYYCFCSKERLDQLREKLQKEKKQLMYDKHCRTIPLEEAKKRAGEEGSWVVRLRVPENKKITVRDGIHGDIVFDSNTVDDQILIKSDGFPTYHLAAVVDDHLMKITHVVRGEEWLTSTPKHVLLYDFFHFAKPLFFHTPVLRNPDKSKLSKRHGHTNVSWYQEQGYLPEAILNFLALMGWSHPKEKEIFLLSEFIALFELKDIKAVAPIFDLHKLLWMNGMYIRQLSIPDLQSKVVERNKKLKAIDETVLTKLLFLAQTRMATLNDFDELVSPFFSESATVQDERDRRLAKMLRAEFSGIHSWDAESILGVLKSIMEKENVKMPTFYTIMTGKEKGLPLPQILEILGKEKTLGMLKKAA